MVDHQWKFPQVIGVVVGDVEPVEHLDLHREVAHLAQLVPG